MGLPFLDCRHFGGVSIGSAAVKEAPCCVVVTTVVGRSDPWRQSSLNEGLSQAILIAGGSSCGNGAETVAWTDGSRRVGIKSELDFSGNFTTCVLLLVQL